MPESRLRTLSIEFAVKILNLVKGLKNQHETIRPCRAEIGGVRFETRSSFFRHQQSI